MGYSVRVLADSVSEGGARLTTLELSYPRFVHAELLTHRALSRNSASSRAIPTARMREMVEADPAHPRWWGRNQSGMQAERELSGSDRAQALRTWRDGLDAALVIHERLEKLGVHKQIANRVLEPWMFITVIVSATEWGNFFALRDTWREGEPPGPAQPEIAWVAREARRAMRESVPCEVSADSWHLPLVTDDEMHLPYVREVSVGRCARVSYLTHDGRRDPIEDAGLCRRLAISGHWSPFEHVATPSPGRHGNFVGWRQFRQEVEEVG